MRLFNSALQSYKHSSIITYRPDYIVLRQTGSVAETARNCMQSLHRSRSVTGGMSKGRPASVRLS